MNENSGIAIAVAKLGEVIAALESDAVFSKFRIEEYEKQIAELKAENEMLHNRLKAAEMRCANG